MIQKEWDMQSLSDAFLQSVKKYGIKETSIFYFFFCYLNAIACGAYCATFMISNPFFNCPILLHFVFYETLQKIHRISQKTSLTPLLDFDSLG